MAKKRKTDKFYPLQRKDVDSLFSSAPSPEPMQVDFGRQANFVHPTKPPETILRWFRVLIDSEAAGASAVGDIPEVGLADNNMRRRDVSLCPQTTDPNFVPGTATEPEPSMWGIELTRYNCEVRYSQFQLGYELIRFPAIKSDADLAAIGTDLKDERVLCWWNSNSGHWEAITGEEGATETPPQPTECCIEFVMACVQQTNECCFLDGILLRVDPVATTDFCNPVKCRQPVWLWCYQNPGPNQPVSLPDEQWCGFGRLIKNDAECPLGTRDVYGIICGNCPIQCPSPTQDIPGSIVIPVECINSPHSFTMHCVNQNPMIIGSDPGWWGEFEITGDYPQIGVSFAVQPFLFNEQLVQEVFVVIGCRAAGGANPGNLCIGDLVYVEQGGGYVQYTGSYTSIQPFNFGAVVPIVVNNCVLQCSRVYRYGIFFQCDEIDGRLWAGKIYRLLPDEMANPRVVEGCPDPDILVPTPDDKVNNGDDILFSTECEGTALGRIDQNVSTTGWTCDIDLPGDTNNVLLPGAPFKYETFGGCQSWQKLIEININEPIPACADDPVTEAVWFFFDWSNDNTCE